MRLDIEMTPDHWTSVVTLIEEPSEDVIQRYARMFRRELWATDHVLPFETTEAHAVRFGDYWFLVIQVSMRSILERN